MDKIFNSRLHQYPLLVVVLVLLILRTRAVRAFDLTNVSITILETAVAKGAVCLDGSPPAYHLDQGSGDGTKKWLIYIQGGGWCQDTQVCHDYSTFGPGSSKRLPDYIIFSGILSSSKTENPDFYKWNRVLISYCDGGSFTGDVEEEVDLVTKLQYRGSRIFDTVIEDLLARGLKNAKKALLAGCSAGGLTTILHCDKFRSLLPKHTKVKCLADAGFFINTKDIVGTPTAEAYFTKVSELHGSAHGLPQNCTWKMKPSLCFFPQNIVKEIKTPLFIVNSATDNKQIDYFLAPWFNDPQGLWKDCRNDSSPICSDSQLETIRGLGTEFIRTLTGLGKSKRRGYFITNTRVHCQTDSETWTGNKAPRLKNKTISRAVADWFYHDHEFHEIASLS